MRQRRKVQAFFGLAVLAAGLFCSGAVGAGGAESSTEQANPVGVGSDSQNRTELIAHTTAVIEQMKETLKQMKPGDPQAPALRKMIETMGKNLQTWKDLPPPGPALPASRPAPLKNDAVERRAAELAKTLLEGRGADNLLRALESAFQAAGFGVRQNDGKITQSEKPGQFMVVNRTELEALAKMSARGMNVPMANLVSGLGKVLPEVRPAELTDLLLDGIRANATSQRTCMRFWSLFIVELGRQSARPYDLLGKVDSAQVQFDAIQTTLILRRLSRDLGILAVKAKEQP